jgi:hypothetical protein
MPRSLQEAALIADQVSFPGTGVRGKKDDLNRPQLVSNADYAIGDDTTGERNAR